MDREVTTQERGVFLRYSSAVIAVLAATLARSAVDPILHDSSPFATYFVAVMFSAWFGGVGPTVLAMILGAAAADYFFIDPRGSIILVDWVAYDREHWVSLVLYVLVGGVMAILTESVRARQRRAEAMSAQLANANRALEKEVADRKQAQESLKHASEELKRSNQDLEQFACIASHDLQEPLRAVGGFVGLLQKQYRGKLDSEADKYIDFAVDGVSRMSQLIHDLLAYSRVGTHGKQPEPTPCGQSLENALTNLQTGLSKQNAKITHDPLPVVMADAAQLTRLFQNLIGNAVKFCRDDAPPEIHVGAKRQSGQWVLWVKDNGIGIPPDQYERIFEIFQRLHGPKKYPGTGIGLAICRKIVERHGGRIWVESSVGEGTTFYFTLPDAGGTAA